MKVIMAPIVTLVVVTLSLYARNTPLTQTFTVTQLALDAAYENDAIIQDILEEIEKEENNTTQHNFHKD